MRWAPTLIIRNLVSGPDPPPVFLFCGQCELFSTRGDPKVVEVIREV